MGTQLGVETHLLQVTFEPKIDNPNVDFFVNNGQNFATEQPNIRTKIAGIKSR